MADKLIYDLNGQVLKRFKDMGDNTHAEVVTFGNSTGSQYNIARSEYRWSDNGAVRTLYADVQNPHASIVLTNYPVRIAVGFGQGEVLSPDQLRLRDAAGNIVPWQWEGGEHPLTGASLEFWPDRSLRCGNIWFNLTAAAGAKSRYLIEKHPVPLGQAFAKNVTYTAVSGTIDELATIATRCRFENTQAWNMRRYQDIANSSFDLFQGATGIFSKMQTSAGTALYSYNVGDVTQVSHGVTSANSFGNGVVFQIYETNFTFNDGTGVAVRNRYRVHADGSVRGEERRTYPTALGSASRGSVLQCQVGATNLTGATDAAHWYDTYSYSSPALNYIFGGYVMQRESAADDTNPGTYTPAAIQESASLGRFGWISTTAINAGVQQRVSWFLTKYSSGDAANEHARRFNRLASIITQPRPETDTADLRRLTIEFATNVQASDLLIPGGWGGVAALFSLFLTGDAVSALRQYQAFCVTKGINPANSANYLALWTSGSQGFEYQGRNTQCLWWLREAFRKVGDSANQTLVESYIHAFADMCVGAEAASGGAGKVKLSGTGSLAWNGATSALAGIAASLAITANSGRQTVFNRIATAFAAGNFAGPIWSYNDITDPVLTPTVHYSGYQLFELSRAYKLQPSMTLPTGDLCNYLRQAFVAEGICNEWYSDLRYRQGAWSTQTYSAAAIAMLNADMGGAYELVRHVKQANNGDVGSVNSLIDGWTRPAQYEGFSGFDVRVLIEVLNWIS